MEKVTIEMNGTLDSYGYQRSNIKYYLSKHAGKAVTLVVNSYGGDVNQALAIAKLLADHGNVMVEFVGFNASAVTFMAFGAAKIQMHEDAFWLGHRCSGFIDVYGSKNAEDLEEIIRELEREKKNQEAVDMMIAGQYLTRCSPKGKSLKDVLELMEQERWLPASEALEWGFVDELLPSAGKRKGVDAGQVLENCAALHLPAPDLGGYQGSDVKTDGTLSRILDGAKSILGMKQKTSPAGDAEPNINNQTPKPIMNKTFVSVMALLALEALEENDGKVVLTVDQLQTLENALAECTSLRAEQKATVEALDAISDHIAHMDGVKNKVQAVAMLVSMVPTGSPAVPVPVDDEAKREKELSDSAQDPVNKVVRGEEEMD